jgi:hypothetical protein
MLLKYLQLTLMNQFETFKIIYDNAEVHCGTREEGWDENAKLIMEPSKIDKSGLKGLSVEYNLYGEYFGLSHISLLRRVGSKID